MTIQSRTKQVAHTLINKGKLAEAKSILYEAYQREPDDIDILFGLGVVHARDGDLISAERWLEKATAPGPANPGPYLHLANTQRQLNKYDEAILNFQKALSKNPGIFEAHLFLAGLFLAKKKLGDAEHHFLHAIRLNPNSADAHANLAQTYELEHKIDEARQHANIALEIDNNHIGALLLSSKINKRRKDYDTAETLLRRILSITADVAIKATASIELGHVLDKQARYDDAYAAFVSGKSAWSQLSENMQLDKDEYHRIIARNTEAFNLNSSRTPVDRPSPPEKPHPVFFVGHPRSGTTLTEQILNQHPRIITSDEKPYVQDVIDKIPSLIESAHPYPDSVLAASNSDLSILREAYWENVSGNIPLLSDDSIFIDKLPLNLIQLGFISRLFPEAKILVAIRDPRDVCLSCFMQSFALNTAMVNFLTMETTVSFYTEVMNLWLHYRSALQINWHQYRYEDLIDDFDNVTRKIFDFIQLDYPANISDYHLTAQNKLISTPSYQDVTQPVYSHSKQRWRNYEKYIAPYIEVLAPFIREFGYSQIE